MSLIFNDLKEGLEEAIAYEKGTGEASVGTYTVLPVKKYNGEEIRNRAVKEYNKDEI